MVPILKHNHWLIAQLPSTVDDFDLIRLRDELAGEVAQSGARGVVLDLTALDVLDSFATRTLQAIAAMNRTRGADTVIVGIQPDVAGAMSRLGAVLDAMPSATNLEEGLALLNQRLETSDGSG